MAASCINELNQCADSIRIPSPTDKVFKDECTYSFDTPDSPDGLYISLSSFLGFGVGQVEKYFNKTKHAAFLHYKRIRHEISVNEADGEKKPTRLAIGVEGGFDADSKRYTVEELYSVVLMPGFRKIQLSDPDLPAKIKDSAAAVIAADSAARQAELAALSGQWDGELRLVSKHAESLVQLNNGVKVPPEGWKCSRCDKKDNLWLNLSDGSILCGRKFFDGSGGNNHAMEHFQETNYPLVVKLGTITPDAADVYSYAEDEMVVDPNLSAHLAHFGIDIMKMEKTDKTMTELELDLNRDWEYSALTESGSELKPVYGPGCTGIHNLGNSCYMNSVMQVLFSMKPFIDRYFTPAVQIFDDAANTDPTSNFNVQMAKFGQGLLSGEYSKPPAEAGKQEQMVGGVRPLMFKTLVGQGHPEFSTKKQQDAQEYLLHIFNLVERNSRGMMNPVDSVRFEVEDRIECTQSLKVKYMVRDDTCLALPVPLEAATNKAEVAKYNAEKEQMEAQGLHVDASKAVRPRIALQACLQAFASPSTVEDFYSSAINAHTTATKDEQGLGLIPKSFELVLNNAIIQLWNKETTRLRTFPDFLFIHLQKFTIGNDWVERKLDVSVEVPDELDLGWLRGSGIQAGEEELPENTTAAPAPAAPAAPSINQVLVGQLLEMGFPLEGCKRAVFNSGNSSVEAAATWAMEHVADPDFSSPFTPQSSAPMEVEFFADEDAIVMVMNMGFERHQALKALKATDNNVERAVDWIFSHPDELNEPENAGPTAQPQPVVNEKRTTDGAPKYRLTAFISHMGTSTKVGHYVCHIRRSDGSWVIYNDEKVCLSERPPSDLAYLYLYTRV